MPTKLRQASGSGFDATLAQEERGAVEGVLIRLVLETRDPPRRRGSFNFWNSPPFPPFPAQGPPILRVPEPLKAAPGASYGDLPGRFIHRSL